MWCERTERLPACRHCDVRHLESLVESSSAPRKMVITDSLFSMDGDFAPLAALAALKRRHPGVMLVVDEVGGRVCKLNSLAVDPVGSKGRIRFLSQTV